MATGVVKKLGRPKICPDQECPLEKYDVRLSFKHARQARKIGDGNLSAGIRIALEVASQNPPLQSIPTV